MLWGCFTASGTERLGITEAPMNTQVVPGNFTVVYRGICYLSKKDAVREQILYLTRVGSELSRLV